MPVTRTQNGKLPPPRQPFPPSQAQGRAGVTKRRNPKSNQESSPSSKTMPQAAGANESNATNQHAAPALPVPVNAQLQGTLHAQPTAAPSLPLSAQAVVYPVPSPTSAATLAPPPTLVAPQPIPAVPGQTQPTSSQQPPAPLATLSGFSPPYMRVYTESEGPNGAVNPYYKLSRAIGTAPAYPLQQRVMDTSMLYDNVRGYVFPVPQPHRSQRAQDSAQPSTQAPAQGANPAGNTTSPLLLLPTELLKRVVGHVVGLKGPLGRRALGYSHLLARPPPRTNLLLRYRVEDSRTPESVIDYLALSLTCKPLYAELGEAFWKRKFPTGDWKRVYHTLRPLFDSPTESDLQDLVRAIIITGGSRANLQEVCDIILTMQGLKSLTFAGLGEIDPTVPVPPTFLNRNVCYVDQLLCQDSMWFWFLLKEKGVKISFNADYEGAYESHEVAWRKLHLLGKVQTPCRSTAQREINSVTLNQYFESQMAHRLQVFMNALDQA
ncbi:uncharacterized protein BDZ99DRAFT_470826 [Mytilinidion resinicola]|uniref:Uncharacterized protein n=1 Tax=Mytilinidion resinicola TaxID=574789 RepID=A0A6A6Z9T1_9PEZI|nr:uncharacterized protein BDZ99DRAFT_470826 [Mytilinidion resinicola]KAF2817881.1 hypothetical protein BDZ99DRAFT_470826 [Mytilinidion resinicola]